MTDYELLSAQVQALAEGCPWDVTLYANVSALLYDTLENLNWAGFYLLRDGELQLGPFQGKTACMRIPVGKGVCGTAVKEESIQRVADVHAFPGHIACDCASASEIVLPFRRGGQIIGVLDIDSPVKDRFSQEDEAGLQRVVEVVEQYLKKGFAQWN
ncbi:MAG: GAF domain-containing protein [Lachnospiraceae bacterium]|nr:GAF domain-containing protein [Lachnospiraceae bacterium]